MTLLRKVVLFLLGSVAVLLVSFLLAVKVFGLKDNQAFSPEKALLTIVLVGGLLAVWAGIRINKARATGKSR